MTNAHTLIAGLILAQSEKGRPAVRPGRCSRWYSSQLLSLACLVLITFIRFRQAFLLTLSSSELCLAHPLFLEACVLVISVGLYICVLSQYLAVYSQPALWFFSVPL